DTDVRWDSRFFNVPVGLPAVAPSLFNALRNTVLRSAMNQRIWINDADNMLVRGDKSHLTRDEINTQMLITSMMGGLFIVGDDYHALLPAEKALIKKFIPSGIDGVLLDTLDDKLPSVYHIRRNDIQKGLGEWHLAGLFNLQDSEKIVKIDPKKLGLDQKKKYHVYEYFSDRYMGICDLDIFSIKLKSHASALLMIKEATDQPQLISSSFHFTQGHQEIEKFEAKEDRISIKMKYPGRNEGSLKIWLPSAQSLSADDAGVKVSYVGEGLWDVKLSFVEKMDIALNLHASAAPQEKSSKLSHLPLYLWRAFREKLENARKAEEISPEVYARIAENGLGIARLDEKGRVVIEKEALPYMLEALNENRTRGEPLAEKDIVRYLSFHENIHRQIHENPVFLKELEKLKSALKDPLIYKGGSIADYQELKQYFVNNYGKEYVSGDIFAEELAVVYLTEKLMLGQPVRLVKDPAKAKVRRILPGKVGALIEESFSELMKYAEPIAASGIDLQKADRHELRDAETERTIIDTTEDALDEGRAM
ncbi:MAG TPA: hypothetical protein VJC03_04025, partial [bacterium]|nr:hypothetical protein [bacterium]